MWKRDHKLEIIDQKVKKETTAEIHEREIEKETTEEVVAEIVMWTAVEEDLVVHLGGSVAGVLSGL